MKKTTLIGIIVIVIDRLSKLIVRGSMIYGESVKITDFFRITYVENTGIAWGIFNGHSLSNVFFIVTNLLALVFLFVKYTSFSFNKTASYGWVMVVSGAIGNLFDRIFVGGVIDFLDFKIFGYDFPVFNVADSAITVGGIVIVLFFLKNVLPPTLNKNVKTTSPATEQQEINYHE